MYVAEFPTIFFCRTIFSGRLTFPENSCNTKEEDTTDEVTVEDDGCSGDRIAEQVEGWRSSTRI